MPTVLRIGGLRVAIFPSDHLPAHVHVIGAEGEAMFILHCPDGRRHCGRVMVLGGRI